MDIVASGVVVQNRQTEATTIGAIVAQFRTVFSPRLAGLGGITVCLGCVDIRHRALSFAYKGLSKNRDRGSPDCGGWDIKRCYQVAQVNVVRRNGNFAVV